MYTIFFEKALANIKARVTFWEKPPPSLNKGGGGLKNSKNGGGIVQ